MTKQRQGEIALLLLKEKFKKEGRLPDVSNFKREVGNVSLKTGISKEELTDFYLLMVEELTSEILNGLREDRKGGAH